MFSALDHIATTFDALGSGEDPAAIDGSLFESLPDRSIPMGELGTLLLRASTTPATRDDIWRYVVCQSRTCQEWTIIAAGLALPGLRHAATRVQRIFPHADTADGDSEVLAGFINALASIDETRPRICSRLCQAAFSQGRSYARRQIAAARAHQEAAHSQTPPPPYGHIDLVLIRAIDEGIISDAGAKLISATRIDGTSLAKTAAALGSTISRVRANRHEAEQSIGAWLSTTKRT